MSAQQREILQRIMAQADTLDSMRDWLFYYEHDKNLAKAEEYAEQIVNEVARLETYCEEFRKAG